VRAAAQRSLFEEGLPAPLQVATRVGFGGRPEEVAPQTPVAIARERVAALAQFRAERASWQIGDTREASKPCPVCGCERIERLEDVAVQGGQTWVVMCLAQSCPRAQRAPAAVERHTP
jgi:hypothetical protein